MKFSYAFAGIAILALTASCSLFEGFNGPSGVDVKVDKTAEINTPKFLGIDGPNVKKASDGTVYVEATGNRTVETSVSGTGAIKMDKPIDITTSAIPGITDPEVGELENPGVAVFVENGASQPVAVTATVNVDGKSCSLPEASVDASKSGKLGYFSVIDGVPDSADYEDIMLLDGGVSSAAAKGPETVEFSDITVIPGKKTKSPAPAAVSAGKVAVSGLLILPLRYKKGSKLHIDKSFKDLNLDVSSFGEAKSGVDVTLEITNKLPFEITLTAKSGSQVKGTLDKAVEAASAGKPAKTSVVMHVDNLGGSVSKLNELDLSVDLVAAQNGAALTLDPDAIKIDVAKIKILSK